MKKFILLIALLTVTLSAKPCMTDIYFGNGVWNDRRDAIDNMDALKKFMLYQANVRLNPNKETVDYQFKYAHNPSYGTIDDIIETFWQLKESGQISEGYFSAVYTALTWEESGELYNKLDDVIQHYNQDVTTMFTIYQNASFNQKHNVLLVAHSQGNLWGNKMYTLLTDAQKKKFRMVSVGTPANHVMEPNQTSPYVTLYGDLIIRPVPNSLPANTNGGGHSFVSAYLGKVDSQIKIASYIKSAYDDLVQTASCSEYAYTRVWMPSFGVLNIYGNVDGEDELVGELVLEQSDAVFNNDDQRYHCPGGEDSVYWGDDSYVGDNWTSNYKDGKNNSWIPGKYITSRSELDDRSNTSDTVLKDDRCITLTLRKQSDLYEMIYEMFDK